MNKKKIFIISIFILLILSIFASADFLKTTTIINPTEWIFDGVNLYTLIKGSVGIGTDTPTENLTVIGNMSVSEQFRANDIFTINISGTGNSVNVFIG